MTATYFPILFSILFLFCTNTKQTKKGTTTESLAKKIGKHEKFNSYWYQGKAEITSYELSQNRYGEIRTGRAVNIFVTEDFLPEKQVKADYKNDKNISILKLNTTRKFITGIYPYSIMTSTFTPIPMNQNSIKISYSSQEWCGNTFVQLNNRENFEVNFHSYFESNADKSFTIQKNILENELWNQLRINPKDLPVGTLNIIPSFEYLNLHHKEIKAYTAKVTLQEKENYLVYTLNYPELNRVLTIKAENNFPFIIDSWDEIFSKNGRQYKNSAKKIKTILSAYWSEKGDKGIALRKELGLK